MSIADEITRLQGDKADIATSIGGKGVTVPEGATFDDYADLIDQIEQGGGGDPDQDNLYGKVIYYSVLRVKINGGQPYCENCTLTIVDEDKWTAFLKDVYAAGDSGSYHELMIEYQGDGWSYRKGWEQQEFVPEDNGVNLVLIDPDMGFAFVSGNLDGKYSDIKTVYIPEAEKNLDGLCSGENEPITVGDLTISKQAVLGFYWGTNVPETIGNGFLSYCTELVFLDLPNYNSSKPSTVGNDFLRECTKVFVTPNDAGTTTLPMKHVGTHFMYNVAGLRGKVLSRALEFPDYYLYNTGVEYLYIQRGLTTLGNYALANTPRLKTINTSYVGYEGTIETVGHHVLENSGLEQFVIGSGDGHKIFSAALKTIGTHFMYKCKNFYRVIDDPAALSPYTSAFYIPSSVTSIGTAFLSETNRLRNLKVDTTVTPQSCNVKPLSVGGGGIARNETLPYSQDVAFAAGISISGTGASAWKTAMPNKNTDNNGYRKWA